MIRYKKSGQNFLIDKNILSKITEKINIKNQNIFEIGAGGGNLTDTYYQKSHKSDYNWEDQNLCNNLLEKVNHHENIKILMVIF